MYWASANLLILNLCGLLQAFASSFLHQTLVSAIPDFSRNCFSKSERAIIRRARKTKEAPYESQEEGNPQTTSQDGLYSLIAYLWMFKVALLVQKTRHQPKTTAHH